MPGTDAIIRTIKALNIALAKPCTIKHGGVEYSFSPLTLSDYGDLLQYNKDREIGAYVAAAHKAKVDFDDQFVQMFKITHRCATEDDFQHSDPLYLIRAVYLSLRHEMPKIPEEAVRALVDDDEFRATAEKVLGVLEAPREPDKDGDVPLAGSDSADDSSTSNR